MHSDVVQYSHLGPAAVLTLNRPDQRNALSRPLIADLTAAVRQAIGDSHARSVILTGNGSAFCAGMDLTELRGTVENAAEAELVWDDAAKLSELFQLLYECPKPTIAAVNGAAVAGGAGLVTVCDLAVSVPNAKFGYPEVRRGLVAAMVLPHLLRHIGERAARWLLLTGELIDADEAKRLGLINGTVAPELLLSTAEAWAGLLAEGGPKALATTKELLRHCSHQAVPVADLANASSEPRLTDECQSGLKAFFGKTKAPWVGG